MAPGAVAINDRLLDGSCCRSIGLPDQVRIIEAPLPDKSLVAGPRNSGVAIARLLDRVGIAPTRQVAKRPGRDEGCEASAGLEHRAAIPVGPASLRVALSTACRRSADDRDAGDQVVAILGYGAFVSEAAHGNARQIVGKEIGAAGDAVFLNDRAHVPRRSGPIELKHLSHLSALPLSDHASGAVTCKSRCTLDDERFVTKADLVHVGHIVGAPLRDLGLGFIGKRAAAALVDGAAVAVAPKLRGSGQVSIASLSDDAAVAAAGLMTIGPILVTILQVEQRIVVAQLISEGEVEVADLLNAGAVVDAVLNDSGDITLVSAGAVADVGSVAGAPLEDLRSVGADECRLSSCRCGGKRHQGCTDHQVPGQHTLLRLQVRPGEHGPGDQTRDSPADA